MCSPALPSSGHFQAIQTQAVDHHFESEKQPSNMDYIDKYPFFQLKTALEKKPLAEIKTLFKVNNTIITKYIHNKLTTTF